MPDQDNPHLPEGYDPTVTGQNPATPSPQEPNDGLEIGFNPQFLQDGLETADANLLEAIEDIQEVGVDIGAIVDPDGIQVVISIPWSYVTQVQALPQQEVRPTGTDG